MISPAGTSASLTFRAAPDPLRRPASAGIAQFTAMFTIVRSMLPIGSMMTSSGTATS